MSIQKMTNLFLLKPNFYDKEVSDNQRYYCPHCALIEGVLGYYPKIRELVNIIYVDFERPRHQIIKLIGEDNQGCPSLIINKNEVEKEIVDAIHFKRNGDYFFMDSTTLITKYLSTKYGIGLLHP